MLQKLKLETTIFKNSFPCGFADKKVFVPEFTFTEVVAPVLAFTTEVKVVSNVTHNCYTEYQRDADPERTIEIRRRPNKVRKGIFGWTRYEGPHQTLFDLRSIHIKVALVETPRQHRVVVTRRAISFFIGFLRNSFQTLILISLWLYSIVVH